MISSYSLFCADRHTHGLTHIATDTYTDADEDNTCFTKHGWRAANNFYSSS